MLSRLTDADYQLRWPRALFREEAARLLNRRQLQDWDARCQLLLEDAFIGDASSGPCSDFCDITEDPIADPWGGAQPDRGHKLSKRQRFLQDLLQNAKHLHEGPQRHRPYWSQRGCAAPSQPARQSATIRQFVALIGEFDDRGYFEKYFTKDCVDDPTDVDPSALIEHAIGVSGIWPVQPDRLIDDLDLFCDVVEVLHDLIARPGRRHLHDYAGCGWHHSQFSIEVGRAIYRWRVNQLLDQSELGLRLAEDGEDIGRMVTVPGDARSELLETTVNRDAADTGDQLRHAIALFRARDSDRHAKRSAVVTLGHVLEGRRDFIKQHLRSKDEDALFQIANKFNLRHQRGDQQGDYDEVFLDWLFWWYLATIDLTDRIATREEFPESDLG